MIIFPQPLKRSHKDWGELVSMVMEAGKQEENLIIITLLF